MTAHRVNEVQLVGSSLMQRVMALSVGAMPMCHLFMQPNALLAPLSANAKVNCKETGNTASDCTSGCGTANATVVTPAANGGTACAGGYSCQPGDGECPADGEKTTTRVL